MKNNLLYSRIKELADKQNLSIRRLEEKLGFGNGVINRWRKTNPGIDKVETVANFFHVSTDYLLGRERPASKEVDLADKDALLMYQGKPVSDEDKEMILRLMRGKKED